MSNHPFSPARRENRRVSGFSKKYKRGVNNVQTCGLGILSAFCWLLTALPALALDYTIAWDWPTNQTTASIEAQYPWLKLGPERVNLAISYDGGTSYSELARGIPSSYGTNTYAISLPDSPAWLSTNAVIRIQTPARLSQPQTTVTRPIQICGLHLVTLPTTITNGSQVQLRWTAAGAGPLIQLGYQVPGDEYWQPMAVFGNIDSSRAAITNTATWYADGLQPGPARIVLQSMSDTNITRIASLEVAP